MQLHVVWTGRDTEHGVDLIGTGGGAGRAGGGCRDNCQQEGWPGAAALQ